MERRAYSVVLMILWIHKDVNNAVISFDAPEEKELDDWIMLSTRERHYTDMANMLEKQANTYKKQEDYRAYKVATDLANELRKSILKDKTIN